MKFEIREMRSSYLGNTFFEYWSAGEIASDKAVVLLMGIPGKAKDYDIIKEFTTAGYDVFLPRYEGTWESKGQLLEQNPVKTAENFIVSLREGITIGNKFYSYRKVCVMGTSFGGGVALSINTQIVDKICVLSPVVSFKEVVGISTLGTYLKDSCGNDYRFEYENWLKLVNDETFSPRTQDISSPEKVMLVAGLSDDQILQPDLERFCKEKGIENFHSENFGHITLSKISNELSKKIINFIEN